MSRTGRLVVFGVGAAFLAVMLVLTALHMPHFGAASHPYRDLAVPAAVRHATANVVTSLNFDQRALDTLGEETMLLASVLGVAVLLRPAEGEEERRLPESGGRVVASTRLVGFVILPVSLIVGIDVVAHGSLTPGGGFQGGVVLGTGVHLLYAAGDFPAVERIRPLRRFHIAEAVAASGYVALGLLGTASAGYFLANVLPHGTFGALYSSGTTAALNALVGLEVVSGVVVLLASFLDQEILVRTERVAGHVRDRDDGDRG